MTTTQIRKPFAVIALDRKRALIDAVSTGFPGAEFDSQTFNIAYICRYDVEIHANDKFVFAEVLRPNDEGMSYSVRGSNMYFADLESFLNYIEEKLA